jgi:hypothetical protein
MKEKGSPVDYFGANIQRKETTRDERVRFLTLHDSTKMT